jgi:flagellar biosynthesis/type III secretory pathway protein FliH
MTLQPFRPRPFDEDSAVSPANSRDRGYLEGLELARIEAVAEARAEVRHELERLAQERDAAIARSNGADAAFESERAEVRRTLEQLGGASVALQAAVQHWNTRETTSVESVQHQVIAFGLEIAELIVKSHPVDARLRAALQDCVQIQETGDPVRIRVHSSCSRTLDALPQGWDRALVTVVPDDSVPPGSVVCEAGPSRLEAGLESSLVRIRRALGVQGS